MSYYPVYNPSLLQSYSGYYPSSTLQVNDTTYKASKSFGPTDGPLSNKFILILTILALIGGVIFLLFWITGSVESPASTDTADSFGDSTESSDTNS